MEILTSISCPSLCIRASSGTRFIVCFHTVQIFCKKISPLTFEFFRNYTKLTMLARKVYIGDRKKYFRKKLPPLRIEPGNSFVLFWCLPDWAILALLGKLILLRSLFRHTLLILAKSYKSKIQLVHKEKWSQIPIN